MWQITSPGTIAASGGAVAVAHGTANTMTPIDSRRARAYRGSLLLAAAFWFGLPAGARAAGGDAFERGVALYAQGDFTNAATSFRRLCEQRASAGAWHNLGNAEWQAGRVGPAVLAWERARWIDPFHAGARANLAFARKAAQLEAPDLAWYELCSAWLPTSWWPWLGAICLWGAAAGLVLPGALRWRRRDWPQGVAAAAFAAFLLVLPGLAGVQSRSRLGVVLASPAPLRLSPTEHAQYIGKLQPGEIVRRQDSRGRFRYVRADNDAGGWVERGEVAWIAEVP